MNTSTSFRLPLALLLGMLILMPNLRLLAQYEDNPNLDQIPAWYRDRQVQSPGDVPLSAVITVNNFDNFNLAVDFAESNMAENPLNPAWYFTAYNK